MCRPVAFLLTGGNVADCTAGEVLIDRMPPTSLLNADKGYDSDDLRAWELSSVDGPCAARGKLS